MAKKSKKEITDFRNAISIEKETRHTILSIVFFVLAAFFILSAFDKAGPAGRGTFHVLTLLFGVGYFLLPASLTILGVAFLKSFQNKLAITKVIGGSVFFISALGLIDALFSSEGGYVGHAIAVPLLNMFDLIVSIIFLVGLLIISMVVVFETKLTLQSLAFWRRQPAEFENEEMDIRIPTEPDISPNIPDAEVEEEEEQPKKKGKEKTGNVPDAGFAPLNIHLGKKYVPPSLSLLERDKGKPGVGDIKANANIIKRTLLNFGINVEMDEISIGPSVTRYALKPAEGVKLARIVALQNDLSLALAAHPLRIEAPIPGKSLVGIELPNTSKTTVGLATILSEPEFQNSDKPLLVALGKGISGRSHYANIAKAPHLLIAGATGSGKSVTIHALLTSLLYRNSPENLKFIMIDPKRVELTLYNKIPHLLTPVITDAKKAILSLKWAAKEMERRYDILEKHTVRDIESYHKNIVEPALKKRDASKSDASDLPDLMPYIVIVIDELADIMQAYPRELESAIVRLAQMSRAVGIHLVLSTQRPSVNVITGLIKANVPSRIALQVASQVDSRTILDMSGAEKLLGAGDMLFISGEMSKPIRIQSAFITESELKNVVKYLSDNYADEIPQEISITGEPVEKNPIFDSTLGDDSLEDDDELYEEAREIVISAGKASTSYLQRKLRVGYARAARLIDMLEERGVIGPGEGSKPREVIDGGAGSGSDEE